LLQKWGRRAPVIAAKENEGTNLAESWAFRKGTWDDKKGKVLPARDHEEKKHQKTEGEKGQAESGGKHLGRRRKKGEKKRWPVGKGRLGQANEIKARMEKDTARGETKAKETLSQSNSTMRKPLFKQPGSEEKADTCLTLGTGAQGTSRRSKKNSPLERARQRNCGKIAWMSCRESDIVGIRSQTTTTGTKRGMTMETAQEGGGETRAEGVQARQSRLDASKDLGWEKSEGPTGCQILPPYSQTLS